MGGLLAMWDYRSLFFVDAVTCWVAAWLLLRLPAPVESERAGADTVGLARSPFRDGPFMLLLLLVIVLAIAFFQIFSTLPLYLSEIYRLQESAIGLRLAFNAVIIAAFEMVPGAKNLPGHVGQISLA